MIYQFHILGTRLKIIAINFILKPLIQIFTLSASILTVASGNYTASSLATSLNNILQTRFPNDNCSCVYNISVGTVTIASTMGFRIMADEFVKSLQGNIAGWYGNNNEEIGHPDYNDLPSFNEVLRYSTISSPNTSFETGFIDLLNVHNVYIHSSNLGHYSSIGVRGENTIINKFLLVVRSGILLWIQLMHLMIKSM